MAHDCGASLGVRLDEEAVRAPANEVSLRNLCGDRLGRRVHLLSPAIYTTPFMQCVSIVRDGTERQL